MEKSNDQFDPEKHKMLEDGESWVLKEVSVNKKFDFEPMSIKIEYNELVDKVAAANPEFTFQQAYNKILESEKKNDYSFVGTGSGNSFGQKLVLERKRISFFADLNLASDNELKKLEKLHLDFEIAVNDIFLKTGDKRREIQENIDSALLYETARDLEEVKEIMINGPIIEGFEKTLDFEISDIKVKEFLIKTFGMDYLRKAKIARITKDDKYLIFRGAGEQHRVEGNYLINQNLGKFVNGMILCENKEDYLKAEMFLEKVSNQDELEHTYKVRATAGDTYGFDKIQLRSFGVEKSSQFDYLKNIVLDFEEDKMLAYILSTIAHEVAHRYEKQISAKIFDEYKKIIEEEVFSQREKYVSDYVLRHKKIYNSNENLLFREDFAEAVRIYTVNSDYLVHNYPRRYEFIKKNFSFIKPNVSIEIIKNKI